MKEIVKKIKKNNKIVIFRHQNPDGDAFGSQYGLAEIIRFNYPEKKVYTIGAEKEKANNIFKLFDGEEMHELTKSEVSDMLVIVVDTANIERIAGDHWNSGLDLLKVDHHPNNDKYSDTMYVDEEAASASEMVSRMARKCKMKVNEKAAQYLISGMMTDTGRFMYPSVSEGTLLEASFLLSKGAKISKVNEALNNNCVKLSRLKGEVLSNFSVKDKVAFYLLPTGMHKTFGVSYLEASNLVYLLNSNNDVEIAFFASYDEEKEEYKASIRSKRIVINGVAEENGGGGHKLDSGLKFKEEKDFKKIVKQLRGLIE